MRPLTVSLTVLALLGLSLPAAAAKLEVEITVTGGEQDVRQAPVRAALSLPGGKALVEKPTHVTLRDGEGKQLAGQLAAPSLLAEGKEDAELWFIVPELAAGESRKYAAEISSGEGSGDRKEFAWKDTPGKYTTLQYGDRPVLRYMYEAFDPERREETYKVYHHVFSPDGSQIVTKGPGGRYTHHRGLFYGFNRVTYDGTRADIWHCSNARQSHEEFLSQETGPVLGRHRVEIDWHGPKEVFASEKREMGAYATEGGTLIEFASILESEVGKVKLDGDPQHAGFQFRASNEVAAETSNQTYYLRPDGKGKPGQTRNWPGNKEHVNLPWNAMSFVVGGQRYTAVYLDRPENPKEARFSERPYGRFGSYFEYELEEGKPLELNYRIWLQAGEMTGEEAAALNAAFVDPPKVAVEVK